VKPTIETPNFNGCICNKDLWICGEYHNTVLMRKPKHMGGIKGNYDTANFICVDMCLAKEIKYLWDLGITTTGNCCGHGSNKGYIGVVDSDIPKMKEMGYETSPGHTSNRLDSFYPKTTKK
jgi:hypothetical protein